MAPDANGTALYGDNNNQHEKLQQRPGMMNGSPKTEQTHLLANGRVPHTGTKSPPADEDRSARQSLIILAAIFFTSLFAMVYVYAMFPELEESEKQYLKVPFDIEDAKQLGRVLDRYKDLYNVEVMFGIILVYIL